MSETRYKIIFRRHPETLQVTALLLFGAFRWAVSKSHFVAIFGLYRVLKSIPDKLCTAMSLKCDPSTDDNGEFLIDLVINQLEYFISKISNTSSEPVDYFDPARHPSQCQVLEYSQSEIKLRERNLIGHRDLLNTIIELKSRLSDMKSQLSCVYFAYCYGRGGVLPLCDDINLLCQIFIHTIHPECLSHSNKFNIRKLSEQRTITIEYFKGFKNSLALEYQRLSKLYHIK